MVTRARHMPTGGRHPRLSGSACGPKTEPRASLRGVFWCASPPQAQWQGAYIEEAHWRALGGGFSLPPSLPSLLLENHATHCKKNMGQAWLSYSSNVGQVCYQAQVKNGSVTFARPKQTCVRHLFFYYNPIWELILTK
jgi:hypothetical protein